MIAAYALLFRLRLGGGPAGGTGPPPGSGGSVAPPGPGGPPSGSVAARPLRLLARLAASEQGRPAYAAPCPAAYGRQVARLAASERGRPVYAVSAGGPRRPARLVAFERGRPVYAVGDCVGSSSGSGGSGSVPAGSGGDARGGSLGPSAGRSASGPSAGSVAPPSGSAPASGSFSGAAPRPASAPSLGPSAVPVGGGSASGSGPSASGSAGASLSGPAGSLPPAAPPVATPCCGSVPRSLVATVTGRTGDCDCMPDAVAMPYQGLQFGRHGWDGEYAGCSLTGCHFNLRCVPAEGGTAAHWEFGVASCNFATAALSESCSPFVLSYAVSGQSDCAGTYVVTITEAP